MMKEGHGQTNQLHGINRGARDACNYCLCVCMCVCVCMHARMCVFKFHLRMFMYVYVYACMHRCMHNSTGTGGSTPQVYKYTYQLYYTLRMHLYIHVHACTAHALWWTMVYPHRTSLSGRACLYKSTTNSTKLTLPSYLFYKLLNSGTCKLHMVHRTIRGSVAPPIIYNCHYGRWSKLIGILWPVHDLCNNITLYSLTLFSLDRFLECARHMRICMQGAAHTHVHL